MSFIADKIVMDGLTYDDVLLIPAYSEVLPRTVDLSTKFSKNIELKIPFVTAAMDTVTEAKMAIAIAREGGIGVIHKNMTIAEQAAHVRRVKRAENGMIYDPITITKDQTVGDALQLMHDNKIGGIPVIDAQNTLIGIVTNRDLRFQRDMSRRIEEVMTKENIITTHSTELEKASEILLRNKIEKLPVVDDHGKLIGLITYKDITKVQDHPNACKDSKGRLRVAAGIGVTADAVERVRALITESVDAVVIDSSHGHSKNVVNTLKRVKSEFPELDVVVGNIATAEAARYLVEAGADGIKVGIGPGSICTTRVVAGVGVPQLTAVYEASLACKAAGVPCIADGGIHYSGDIAKALVAGASSVMLGGTLAGCEEAPGEKVLLHGKQYKLYRGMGSLGAMAPRGKKSYSKDRYFQADVTSSDKVVPEGVEGEVPYRGPLNAVLYQMIGGLHQSMFYIGAHNIKEMSEKGRFIRITDAGLRESHPHDIVMTAEAPNYSGRQ